MYPTTGPLASERFGSFPTKLPNVGSSAACVPTFSCLQARRRRKCFSRLFFRSTQRRRSVRFPTLCVCWRHENEKKIVKTSLKTVKTVKSLFLRDKCKRSSGLPAHESSMRPKGFGVARKLPTRNTHRQNRSKRLLSQS